MFERGKQSTHEIHAMRVLEPAVAFITTVLSPGTMMSGKAIIVFATTSILTNHASRLVPEIRPLLIGQGGIDLMDVITSAISTISLVPAPTDQMVAIAKVAIGLACPVFNAFATLSFVRSAKGIIDTLVVCIEVEEQPGVTLWVPRVADNGTITAGVPAHLDVCMGCTSARAADCLVAVVIC